MIIKKEDILFIEKSSNKNFQNLEGIVFGQLKILGYAGIVNKKSHWYCQCSCRNYCIILANSLLTNNTNSCGCLFKKLLRERNSYTSDEFFKRLNEINLNKNYEIISEYNGINIKLLIKNKYGTCLIKPTFLLQLYNPSIKSAINKTEYFINQAKEVHGNKYLYDNFKYTNSRSKGIITCRIHKNFEIILSNFLRGAGCLKCSRLYSRLNKNRYLNELN